MSSIKDRVVSGTNSVTNGKNLIKTAINNNGGSITSSIPTFQELANGVTNISKVPNSYVFSRSFSNNSYNGNSSIVYYDNNYALITSSFVSFKYMFLTRTQTEVNYASSGSSYMCPFIVGNYSYTTYMSSLVRYDSLTSSYTTLKLNGYVQTHSSSRLYQLLSINSTNSIITNDVRVSYGTKSTLLSLVNIDALTVTTLSESEEEGDSLNDPFGYGVYNGSDNCIYSPGRKLNLLTNTETSYSSGGLRLVSLNNKIFELSIISGYNNESIYRVIELYNRDDNLEFYSIPLSKSNYADADQDSYLINSNLIRLNGLIMNLRNSFNTSETYCITKY